MAVATARVAGLAGTTETTTVAASEASLGAVAGNVAHLTALSIDQYISPGECVERCRTYLVALSGLAVTTAGRAFA